MYIFKKLLRFLYWHSTGSSIPGLSNVWGFSNAWLWLFRIIEKIILSFKNEIEVTVLKINGNNLHMLLTPQNIISVSK